VSEKDAKKLTKKRKEKGTGVRYSGSGRCGRNDSEGGGGGGGGKNPSRGQMALKEKGAVIAEELDRHKSMKDAGDHASVGEEKSVRGVNCSHKRAEEKKKKNLTNMNHRLEKKRHDRSVAEEGPRYFFGGGEKGGWARKLERRTSLARGRWVLSQRDA